MGECICSSCINLKSVFGENGEVTEYTCTFGFPSDKCEDCEGGECSEKCGNYRPDSEDIKTEAIACKSCGKELTMVVKDDPEGNVFCIDCYLKGI